MGRKAGGGKVEIPQKERARDFHFPTTPTAAAGFLTEPISNPPALDTVSHSYTSMPPEGYDVGRLYHSGGPVCKTLAGCENIIGLHTSHSSYKEAAKNMANVKESSTKEVNKASVETKSVEVRSSSR